jgi:hypothetical protein
MSLHLTEGNCNSFATIEAYALMMVTLLHLRVYKITIQNNKTNKIIYLPDMRSATYFRVKLRYRYIYIYIFFFSAQQPPVAHGLLIHKVYRSNKTTHHSLYKSSGRVNSSSQRPLPDNTKHSQQPDIHDPVEIRTRNLSRQAAENLPLRPRGHCYRQRIDKENEKENSTVVNIEYSSRDFSLVTCVSAI